MRPLCRLAQLHAQAGCRGLWQPKLGRVALEALISRSQFFCQWPSACLTLPPPSFDFQRWSSTTPSRTVPASSRWRWGRLCLPAPPALLACCPWSGHARPTAARPPRPSCKRRTRGAAASGPHRRTRATSLPLQATTASAPGLQMPGLPGWREATSRSACSSEWLSCHRPPLKLPPLVAGGSCQARGLAGPDLRANWCPSCCSSSTGSNTGMLCTCVAPDFETQDRFSKQVTAAALPGAAAPAAGTSTRARTRGEPKETFDPQWAARL
jgi:hypothetical protein